MLLAYSPNDAFAQTVVKNVQLSNVMNNETVSLESYASPEGLIVIFTSNACPYDGYYRDRIAKLSAQYGKKVPLLLVNSGGLLTIMPRSKPMFVTNTCAMLLR